MFNILIWDETLITRSQQPAFTSVLSGIRALKKVKENIRFSNASLVNYK